jgi:hypothetical protein
MFAQQDKDQLDVRGAETRGAWGLEQVEDEESVGYLASVVIACHVVMIAGIGPRTRKMFMKGAIR